MNAPKPSTIGGRPSVERLVIRPYSGIIFFYPTFLAAIVCGIAVGATGATPEAPGITGLIFTLIFFLNLSIIAFDYTRLVSIIIVLMVVIIGMLTAMYPGVGEAIHGLLNQPLFMNSTFYWMWATGIGLLLLFTWLRARFDYWEIKNNELLHHHGLLGDVQRYPSPGLRVTKEIPDVLEYLLLGSGRLLIMPDREAKMIVIQNVPRINRVEATMRELLSMLRVADGD